MRRFVLTVCVLLCALLHTVSAQWGMPQQQQRPPQGSMGGGNMGGGYPNMQQQQQQYPNMQQQQMQQQGQMQQRQGFQPGGGGQAGRPSMNRLNPALRQQQQRRGMPGGMGGRPGQGPTGPQMAGPDFPPSMGLNMGMLGPGDRKGAKRPPIDLQVIQTPATYEQIDSALDRMEYPAPFPYKLRNIYSTKPAVDRDFFYFLHVPKTAGQAFHGVITFYFHRNAHVVGLSKFMAGKPYTDPMENRFRVSPECLSVKFCNTKSRKQRMAPRFDLSFAANGIAENLKGHVEEASLYVNMWDFLVGHADVSLLNVLPAERRMVVATFVRDPVARFYSFYDFLQSHSSGIYDCMEKFRDGKLNNNRGARRPAPGGPMRRLLEAISEQMESKQVFRGEDGALYHYPTYGEEEGVAAGERKLLGGPQADRYSKCNSRIAQGVVTKQLNSPEKLFENKAAEIAECRTRKMLTLDAVPYKYDLMDFLQLTIDMEQDNYMTRAFSGTLAFSFFGNPSQITDDQKLTLAKKAMRRFAFIGDTSDYATAVDLFYFTFNIDYVQKKADDLANAKRNVSAKKTEKIPAVDAAVLAANKLDEAVYNDAKALYAEKLELMHKLKQDASYQPPSSERDHADVKILFGDD